VYVGKNGEKTLRIQTINRRIFGETLAVEGNQLSHLQSERAPRKWRIRYGKKENQTLPISNQTFLLPLNMPCLLNRERSHTRRVPFRVFYGCGALPVAR
jgi:hypothetical protein